MNIVEKCGELKPSSKPHIPIILSNNLLYSKLKDTSIQPAASACFDMVWKDIGFGHPGFEMKAAVADLKRLTMGLTPPSWDCNIWPSIPGTMPSQGAVCIKCVVSTSLCSALKTIFGKRKWATTWKYVKKRDYYEYLPYQDNIKKPYPV